MMSPPAVAQASTLAHPDGLPTPRRYWSVAAIVLALAMTVIDSTIANVALPTIGREFHASKAASIWIINAYQVAILAALLPLASLGEIIGYRRVSQLGMAVFVAASVGCALSTSLPMMSIARVVQGLGAAGVMAVNTALVRFTWPHAKLGRAIGINAFSVAVAGTIGPTVCSAILAVANWRWLFGINVPIGIAAVVIAHYALPVTPLIKRRPNLVGAALHAVTFALFVSGLQALAHDSATLLGLMQIVAALLVGVVLVRHELGRSAPILPFDLLRIRLFSLSIATSVGSFTAQMVALVALPFEIQRLGHSAVETGLYMVPWAVSVGIAAPLAGRLADRHPAGILSAIGLLAMAAGLLSLAFFPPAGNAFDWTWRMTLCGLGFGFFQTPNNRTMVSAAPRERSGAAGGMLSTARLLGQTLGAAAVAIVFRAYPRDGSNIALCVAAAISFVAVFVSLARLRQQKTPAEASDLIEE
jgi:DHA2 family multidrug resistance protein-like MFS transporter